MSLEAEIKYEFRPPASSGNSGTMGRCGLPPIQPKVDTTLPYWKLLAEKLEYVPAPPEDSEANKPGAISQPTVAKDSRILATTNMAHSDQAPSTPKSSEAQLPHIFYASAAAAPARPAAESTPNPAKTAVEIITNSGLELSLQRVLLQTLSQEAGQKPAIGIGM